MTGEVLLEQLRDRDIRLSANGDRLVIDAPRGALTEQFRRSLQEHKAELLAIVTAPDQWVRRASVLFSGLAHPD